MFIFRRKKITPNRRATDAPGEVRLVDDPVTESARARDLSVLRDARATHNPRQTLMPEGFTVTQLVELAHSVPAMLEAQRTIAQRFEQFVGNIAALNTALGEFKQQVMLPFREELHHLRYNTGDRMTQVCTDLDSFVSKLDQVVWGALRANGMSDDQIRRYREEHGMQPEAPTGPELVSHLRELEALRRSNADLVVQNQRLLARLDTKHTFSQGEDGWVWHQDCECVQCQQRTQQIAAEQDEALGRLRRSQEEATRGP